MCRWFAVVLVAASACGCARGSASGTGAGEAAVSFGSSTATRSSSASAARDETVRLIGIDTPETVEARHAGAVLRQGGVAPDQGAAARRHRGPPRTRRRGARPLRPPARLRLPGGRRPVRQPRRSLQDGLRRACSTIPPNVAYAASSRGRGRRRPPRPGGACGGHARRAGSGQPASVRRRDDARRTARATARRPAAHHQLRRPRLVPRGQRRRATRRCARAWPRAPSLMVPARGPARRPRRYRGEDIGVHLTLNAEHELYRWGPITHAPSLLDGDGGFPRTRRRPLGPRRPRRGAPRVPRPDRAGHPLGLRRQPSRLAPRARCSCGPSSSTSTSSSPSTSRLPIRLPSASTEAAIGLPVPPAGRRGGRACSPTTSCTLASVGQPARASSEPLRDLQPGVTEVHVHPAVDTPELRALSPDWAARVDDHELVVHDEALARLARAPGAHLIGFRQLRTAQREG